MTIKKIIFIYLLFYASLFSQSEDIIQTIQKKEKAFLDIEITKLNTTHLKPIDLDFKNKIITLANLSLQPSQTLLLNENSEIFSALYSVNGRLPALKQMAQQTNLSYTQKKSGEIEINYNRLPTTIYAGLWNKNSKNLEKIFEINVEEMTQLKTLPTIKFDLSYSKNQHIYIDDYDVNNPYFLNIGKIHINNPVRLPINVKWENDIYSIPFEVKGAAKDAWADNAFFSYNTMKELHTQEESGVWDIVLTIPPQAIKAAVAKNLPLQFKNDKRVTPISNYALTDNSSAGIGPYIIHFKTSPKSMLKVEGLTQGKVILDYGELQKGKESYSTSSQILTLKRENFDEDLLISNSPVSFQFSNNGDITLVKNNSSSKIVGKLEVSNTSSIENKKNLNFTIKSSLSEKDVNNVECGSYFGSSTLNIIINN
jgi:hypothetical protein